VTLLELIIVIVIMGILAGIAVPSYRYVTTDNRMATESDALLGDMQYARSEAAREGQNVTLCVAASGTTPACAAAGSTDWQNGWLVFADIANDQKLDTGDPLLRQQRPFSSSDTFVSSNSMNAVTFTRDGFANLNGSNALFTLHDSSNNSKYTRCLELTQAGMMSVQTPSSDPTNCS
jgi:type IV fimbrial biogenesis protein FimT